MRRETIYRGATAVIPIAVLIVSSAAAGVQDVPPAGGGTPVVAPHERLKLTSGSFRVRRTEHFTISYDTSPEMIGGFAGLVEQVYNATEAFATQRGLTVPREGVALDVLFFDRYEAYEQFTAGLGRVVATTTAGYFSWSDRLAVFYNTLSRPDIRDLTARISEARQEYLDARAKGGSRRDQRVSLDQLQRRIALLESRRDALVSEANRVTLRHEVAHQCLFHHGVHDALRGPPTWLVEGLACQFEDVQTVSKGRLLRVNEERLKDFRDSLGWPPRGAANRGNAGAGLRPEESTPVVALREFVAHPHLIADRRDRDAVRLYAQSWALVFYLQSMESDAFTSYLRSLNARPIGANFTPEEEIAAFEACFGPLDAAWQGRWLVAMSKLDVP